MSCSILHAISDRRGGPPVEFAKKVCLQLLNALNFLRTAEVMHCDLKPENVLLFDNQKSGVRVIDLGSSCFFRERNEYFEANQYIQSRFYRAPQVILVGDVSFPIDMWSMGCIVAEIILGMPLFPGQSCEDQLSLFVEVLGLPSEIFLKTCAKAGTFFGRYGEFKSSRVAGCNPLHRIFGGHDPLLVDFLGTILRWDPRERADPMSAMRHRWLQSIFTVSSESARMTNSSQGKYRELSRRKKKR